MSEILKILHLEDFSDDAELVSRELKKAGIRFDMLLTENKDEFSQALHEFSPDIILSDHSLGSFDSREALRIVKNAQIDVPFILVTATVSEEYAVSVIKEGASDYILKDRLQRLPSAILMARKKYILQKEKQSAFDALQDSEQKYKLLFHSNPMSMWMLSVPELKIIAVNDSAVREYGYSRQDFLDLYGRDLGNEENRQGIWPLRKKDGSIIMADMLVHDIRYGDFPAKLVLAHDVTARLDAEEKLAEQQRMQQKLVQETSIQAQEKEREEIGRELHDNINQILASAKMYLEFGITKEKPESTHFKSCRENIILAITEIRKLSHSLIPPALRETDLITGIEGLLEEVQMMTPVKTSVSTENYNENVIPDGIKLMLFRVVQEQVNNILKHAEAGHIIVTLKSAGEHFRLTIEDDGRGFDPKLKSDGVGIRNIKQRAEFYDGNVQIISSPGNGCLLELIIPGLG